VSRQRPAHVCSVPGCPELTPCPTHSRPADAPWTPDRDHRLQRWFRKLLMSRSDGICERCRRAPATVAHHVRPGYDADCGLALCDACHMALDNKARPTRRKEII
jgi:hypothetical protein